MQEVTEHSIVVAQVAKTFRIMAKNCGAIL
jgi:hypothetical protein